MRRSSRRRPPRRRPRFSACSTHFLRDDDRMRWVALALVVACSPKENPEDKRVPPKQPRFAVDALVPTYSDDPPWDAAEIDAPIVETGPLTITPPQQPGTPPPAGVLAIARVPNGWRKVDVAALTVTGDSVAIPAGEPIE